MSRQENLNRWKTIVDNYRKDEETETVKEYCERIGINRRLFYHYREVIYGSVKGGVSKEVKLLPVVVEDPGNTSIQINRVNYHTHAVWA